LSFYISDVFQLHQASAVIFTVLTTWYCCGEYVRKWGFSCGFPAGTGELQIMQRLQDSLLFRMLRDVEGFW